MQIIKYVLSIVLIVVFIYMGGLFDNEVASNVNNDAMFTKLSIIALVISIILITFYGKERNKSSNL